MQTRNNGSADTLPMLKSDEIQDDIQVFSLVMNLLDHTTKHGFRFAPLYNGGVRRVKTLGPC